MQLVLTGRSAFAQSLRGGVVSPHIWRFADQTTRLEFLLAGFGWCNMPLHMVQEHVAAGRLKRLELLHAEPPPEFPLYVVNSAQPPARPRRPLARCGFARASETLPGRVPRGKGGRVTSRHLDCEYRRAPHCGTTGVGATKACASR